MLSVVAPKSPSKPQQIELPHQALAPEKLRAIELLLLGESVTDTVRKLGIDRKTLYRWRKSPQFQAETNRRQKELMESTQQRLRRLSVKAVEVIEKHLDSGDLKAATALLKIVSAMAPPDTETNPQTLLKRQSEQALWAYWHRQPFAEKQFGHYSLNNNSFTGFCDEIYDFEARRYGIAYESEVDEIMTAMQAEGS